MIRLYIADSMNLAAIFLFYLKDKISDFKFYFKKSQSFMSQYL